MTRPELPDAWIELPDPQDLRPRSGGEKGPYDFGFVPNMIRLLMAHKGIGAAFGNLLGAIMFTPGHLDRREREMIAAVTASAQDCFY